MISNTDDVIVARSLPEEAPQVAYVGLFKIAEYIISMFVFFFFFFDKVLYY